MKILVVDDHALIRKALQGVLRELIADPVLVEAARVRDALALLAEHSDIELVLLDLNLPDADGFALLDTLRERCPDAGVVVLSASCERNDIARALDLGALGFIPKITTHEVMLSALRLVLDGGLYVPPAILSTRPQSETSPPAVHTARRNRIPGLTERQLDVLALMMEGLSNKAICRRLDLAEPTVKNHVTAILRVLKATNRTEAVLNATALGFGSELGSGH